MTARVHFARSASEKTSAGGRDRVTGRYRRVPAGGLRLSRPRGLGVGTIDGVAR